MKIKHYWKVLTRKIDASHPARVTFKNIKAVIQSWFRKTRMIAGMEIEAHIYEQIIWRRTEVIKNSPRCWYGNACKVCGCDILGKTMEDRGCSIAEHPELLEKRQPCYPAMMNKEEWENFKKLKAIKLFD